MGVQKGQYFPTAVKCTKSEAAWKLSNATAAKTNAVCYNSLPSALYSLTDGNY